MVDVRRAVLVLTLAGCNQVYGLDPTTVRTLEPPLCSTVQFSVPQVLPEFESDDDIEYDPQLSADGKELWLVFSTSIGGSNRDLMYRSVLEGDRFGEPVLTDLVGMNDQHTGDPSLTADGLRLIFRVEGEPTPFEAIRKSPQQFPFDTVVPVLGLPSEVRSFDVTWDGLRIYFADSDGELRMATRAARNTPFVVDDTLLASNAVFPTISGDELELFHSHPSEPNVYRRERATASGPFGPELLVVQGGADPDIAPTSSEMLVSYDGALAIMKRTCDED